MFIVGLFKQTASSNQGEAVQLRMANSALIERRIKQTGGKKRDSHTFRTVMESLEGAKPLNIAKVCGYQN